MKDEEQNVTTAKIEWIKYPHTTAEMGNKVVISGSTADASKQIEMSAPSQTPQTVTSTSTAK